MTSLPKAKTQRGRKLVWRNGPLTADDPVSVWNGLLDARGLMENDPFFSPQLADLPDPFGMTDMGKAADRVAEAILGGEKIHVFGDFDADGVNGTAILLESLRGAGAPIIICPKRNFPMPLHCLIRHVRTVALPIGGYAVQVSLFFC